MLLGLLALANGHPSLPSSYFGICKRERLYSLSPLFVLCAIEQY